FIEDWHVETGKMLDTEHLFEPENISSGGACLQTVPSGPSYQTENYQRLIIASIIGAQEQVTITTPYLIPDVGMMQAIEVARLRGVKVRLVVPEKSDQFIVGYAARAYYEDLLKLGVDIYLYGEGLLHAKTITVDNDLGFVGSSNFDIRSFSLNFEINMIFYGIGETYRIHTIQGEYICQSRRLTMQQWQERSHISMALESVTKLLSPLL
ncbi:MAG: phospholipase D-like domain-containing protein, partial [Pyramidobacter sp.]|nr:phospholipase D-like domain-containing protein [Pyramidobacter sp.]